ncbi:MAG TPA: hypothetical protein VGJ46_06655 [Candidatus Limnocylindrales bacterium]
MAEPIIFITHFRVKEGMLDQVRQMTASVMPRMEAEKPQTLLMHAYLDEAAERGSIIHMFGSPASMDAHFEGADERSRAAYESIVPEGWEIYGAPSQAALDQMRTEAARAGVGLRYEPEQMGGFIRLG